MIETVVRQAYASRMLNNHEIKRRRLARKLSMNEAAVKAGIGGRQNWYRIESGARTNVTSDTLARIAGALGCKMEALLTK